MLKGNKTFIKTVFNQSLKKLGEIEERDDLLKRMGVGKKKVKDLPIFVDNAIEVVINPYLVAKFHSQYGFPKETVLEMIEENGISIKDYWSDWCDFWVESFITIPHNILCDSKEYYKAMQWETI